MKEAESDPLNRTERDPVVDGFVWLLAMVTGTLVVLAALNVNTLLNTARHAAQSALWNEVNNHLKARELTGHYPAALADLPLTFPDRGSPELLKLIDYRRDDAGCEVSMMFRGRKLERRYGKPGA